MEQNKLNGLELDQNINKDIDRFFKVAMIGSLLNKNKSTLSYSVDGKFRSEVNGTLDQLEQIIPHLKRIEEILKGKEIEVDRIPDKPITIDDDLFTED